jgi:transposase
MEATSDHWRAPFYLPEDRFQTWLVNAHDVKHLPGRPKTDRLDAVWLCKVAERQMLRPCFVPPPQIRQLRDLTRYRVGLLAVRTAEKQRVEKLLEDALIKLSVVVSDAFGPPGPCLDNRPPPDEPGLRTAARALRSDDQVGHDRPDGPPPRAGTRAPSLATGTSRLTLSQHLVRRPGGRV